MVFLSILNIVPRSGFVKKSDNMFIIGKCYFYFVYLYIVINEEVT